MTIWVPFMKGLLLVRLTSLPRQPLTTPCGKSSLTLSQALRVQTTPHRVIIIRSPCFYSHLPDFPPSKQDGWGSTKSGGPLSSANIKAPTYFDKRWIRHFESVLYSHVTERFTPSPYYPLIYLPDVSPNALPERTPFIHRRNVEGNLLHNDVGPISATYLI